jgi:hypothetical protein
VPEPIAGPGETGAKTHSAQDRDRPRGGRDQLSYPETKQMRRGAHSDQHAGPARQCHNLDHGDAEQDVTDHEQDCRQPIDDHHRQVLVDGVQYRRRLFSQDRGEETEVPGDRDQIGAGESGRNDGPPLLPTIAERQTRKEAPADRRRSCMPS